MNADRDLDLAPGPDWRLAPAALAVWLATMAGLLLGWWWAAIGSAVTMAGGCIALAAARRRPTVVRWWRLGVGWSLVVCGLLLAVSTTGRLRAAAEDPLRQHATDGVSGVFRVTVTERPRPVFSTGFGGQRGGVRAVVVPARVRDAVVTGSPVVSTGRVVVIAPVDRWSKLLPGQDVTATAQLAPARIGELTVAVLRVRGPPEDPSEAAVWQRVAQELRSGLRDAAGVLDPEPAGLLPGLVVGDTDTLSRQVEEEFKTAGLAHLLAVSGTNLAIVCVAVLLLLRAIRVGPRGAAAGAMLALVAFVVLAGPEPSVLRAGVMGAVGLLALAIGRERAALPALGTAVVVLVLWDPAMAVSFGFALSVLATAGLVLLAPRWADRLAARGVPRGLAEALAVPAAAHLVTAPVVAGMAGQVSLVAVLANLLAALVVAPATVLGVLAALVAPVWPWLAELLVRLAGPEVDWLILVARHGSRVPGAAIDWPSGWWGGLLLLGCVSLLVVVLRRRQLRVLVGAALTGLLIVVIPVRVIAPGWPPPGWAMVACDVGQGDALVLATGEAGRAVVVDAGPEPGPLAGCLDRLDVSRVPLVVLSHLHADHVGGLDAVLDGRAVGAVGVGPARAPDWAWEEVRSKAAAAGVPIVQLDAGRRMAWPGLSIEVLAPTGRELMPTADADGTEINNASVVLRAATPAGRILLSGDVELTAQANLLSSRADLAAEVIKVPHHGSRYTTPELFAAIRPRIAVVSVGVGNRYGHPSPFTLRALSRVGTLIVRTDTAGDAAIVPGEAGPRAVTRGPARGPPAARTRRRVVLDWPGCRRADSVPRRVRDVAQVGVGGGHSDRARGGSAARSAVRHVHRDRTVGSARGRRHRNVASHTDAQRDPVPIGCAEAAVDLERAAPADHTDDPGRGAAAGQRRARATRLRAPRNAPRHLQRAGHRCRTAVPAPTGASTASTPGTRW
ncbi:MAG TPA: ComEC/Rec2 family competence protein, partial [Actinophytocola sp.]|nr:ComEC/Rec2 family competence protein [Actinophytocola sp.]